MVVLVKLLKLDRAGRVSILIFLLAGLGDDEGLLIKVELLLVEDPGRSSVTPEGPVIISEHDIVLSIGSLHWFDVVDEDRFSHTEGTHLLCLDLGVGDVFLNINDSDLALLQLLCSLLGVAVVPLGYLLEGC